MRPSHLLASVLLLIAGCDRASAPPTNVVGPIGSPNANHPFLAIWRADEGRTRLESEAPYLRIAIWNDGRIVFAQDSAIWDHNLREGKLKSNDVSELKEAIVATGVFELLGYCYLVPDAAMDCIMVKIGDKDQILYWDEVEHPGYGININPQHRHLDFINAWKALNRLALSYTPAKSSVASIKFDRVPRDWYLKEAIQSP